MKSCSIDLLLRHQLGSLKKCLVTRLKYIPHHSFSSAFKSSRLNSLVLGEFSCVIEFWFFRQLKSSYTRALARCFVIRCYEASRISLLLLHVLLQVSLLFSLSRPKSNQLHTASSLCDDFCIHICTIHRVVWFFCRSRLHTVTTLRLHSHLNLGHIFMRSRSKDK